VEVPVDLTPKVNEAAKSEGSECLENPSVLRKIGIVVGTRFKTQWNGHSRTLCRQSRSREILTAKPSDGDGGF
jgi:hypothetical protein